MIGELEPVLQPYDWGSVSAIPAFLGVPETGEPVAEAWYGAHPSAPSTLIDDGRRTLLSDVIDGDAEVVLGASVAQRFDSTLPFLVKVLAAARPLSIQAHPSTEQAAAGFARENAAGIALDAPTRLYRDPNAKPEVMVALEPFELLYGLRDPVASAALLDQLTVPSLAAITERLRTGDDLALREVAVSLTGLSVDERATAIDELVAACDAASPEVLAAHAATCRWIAPLGREHPDDIGVLFALLMNHHELLPMQAVFLPARTLHAYLRGTGIEVMGNSDNVIRAGLTSKAVAIDELLAVVDFSAADPVTLAAPPVDERVTRWTYPIPTDEFAVELLSVDDQSLELDVEVDGPEILVALDGSATIDPAGTGVRQMTRGDVVFVAAATDRYRVGGAGQLVRVHVIPA